MSTKTNLPTTSAISPSGDPVIDGLNVILADSYALMAQTHIAHWNVEGPDFFHLHTAFQTQYEELFTAVDDIAERVRSLGGYALGGLATLAAVSPIKELPSGHVPTTEIVQSLLDAHMLLIERARPVREVAEEKQDLETQDMVIARIQTHEKTAWMLRSYLGKKAA